MSSGNICPRCRQELPASGYCLSCGFQGSDGDAKKFTAYQNADRRIERAKALGRLFRFWRWGHWLR